MIGEGSAGGYDATGPSWPLETRGEEEGTCCCCCCTKYATLVRENWSGDPIESIGEVLDARDGRGGVPAEVTPSDRAARIKGSGSSLRTVEDSSETEL